MKLRETYCGKKPYSLIEITVDYDPDADTLDDLISVKAIGKDCTVDLTEICSDALLKYFNNIIDDIDWRAIYREYKILQDKTFSKLPNYGKVK